MNKETLEEANWKVLGTKNDTFYNGAKWQQERSQKIVPFDAVDIEVFAIKPDEDGKLFAYIGYKIANGNFEFNVVPFTEPQAERMYSEEDVKQMLIDCCGEVSCEDGVLVGKTPVELYKWIDEQFKKK